MHILLFAFVPQSQHVISSFSIKPLPFFELSFSFRLFSVEVVEEQDREECEYDNGGVVACKDPFVALLTRANSSRTCFYTNLNFRNLRKLYGNRDCPETVKEEHMVQANNKAESTNAGSKVLPLCDSTLQAAPMDADYSSDASINRKRRAISRLKELLRWAPASRSEKGLRRWKVKYLRSKGTLKDSFDEASSSSSKISFTWDVGSCSTASALSPLSLPSSSVSRRASTNQLECISEEIWEDQKNDECPRIGNWITTDSDCNCCAGALESKQLKGISSHVAIDTDIWQIFCHSSRIRYVALKIRGFTVPTVLSGGDSSLPPFANMSEATETSRRDHMLLFPFMAQGHLIPFLSLAHFLEQKTGCTITVVTTPLNVRALQSSLPAHSTIRFSSLPFHSSHHGLPPHAENTNSIPPHLFLRFIHATRSLQPPLERLVSEICARDGRPPLCIISDEFMSWSVETARKFGTFHSVVQTSGAYGSVVFCNVWNHLPHRQTDADEFELPEFPGVSIHRSQLTDACRKADDDDPWTILFRKVDSYFHQSDGILINTTEELESKALMQMRKNLRRNVWAIGPLITPPSFRKKLYISSESCTGWLDLHPLRSVLYISFGSQTSIHPHQMMELAKGLEACGNAFIWVIKPPTGFDVNGELRAEWLPEGFEERMGERKQGLLVKNWAPQLEILSHESVGAFLTHCGWNSILESLSQGVPMIGWPMMAEQHFNSKQLEEELGVGIELVRGSTAEVRAADVVRVVGMVMGEESEKGKEMRSRAKEIKEVMKAALVDEDGCKGSSIRAVQDFLQTALSRS
ncbi:hypothetical protein ACLOJK_011100 [Asimina triloba]